MIITIRLNANFNVSIDWCDFVLRTIKDIYVKCIYEVVGRTAKILQRLCFSDTKKEASENLWKT